jgi:glycosyltransferase involved in cell wall biosynthesis
MKLLEYMALGAVPVAPDYPPIREIISDGRTGLIFPPRSKLDFVECIVGLAENRSLLQSLGNAAKEEVLKERTWTKNAQSIIDLSMKIVKH